MKEYLQYYYKLDPHVDGLEFRPPALTTDQIISYSDLVRTEYYNEFLKQQSIYYQMDMLLKSNTCWLGVMAFLRPKSESNFSSRDIFKAGLIASQLGTILETKMLLQQSSKTSAIFETIALNHNHKGVILLDEFLEPIYADKNGKSVISSFCRNNIEDDKSKSCIPSSVRQCCRGLERTAISKGDFEQFKTLNLDIDKSGQNIPILIRLIRQQNGSVAFLLCIQPSDYRSFLSTNQYLMDLDLTEREREIAHHLFKGLNAKEISDKLFISKYTVQNHIKSIYAKLGVNSLGGFMNRMMQVMQ
jgi:DNA-binding CsgD family transcriptional regulator